MKAYLVLTGCLFGLLGAMHLGNAIFHFHGGGGVEFYAENLTLGGVAAGLAVWGLRLSARA
jgi:high-affinity Fe2+/Pb2+ permease